MSKSNKNGYIIYTLRKPYSFDRSVREDFKWFGTLYKSRKALVARLIHSSILNNLSKDKKETSAPYDYSKWEYKYLYFITRVVGNEEYYVNIEALRKEVEAKEAEVKPHGRWRRYWAVKDKYVPEFRKDPIPWTGHGNHVGHGHDCRHSGVKRYVQQNSDPEYKEFSSTKYNNPLKLDRWDWDSHDYRFKNHNWKRQYKVRHQWEVHKPKHRDEVYYDKRSVSVKEELGVLSELREP